MPSTRVPLSCAHSVVCAYLIAALRVSRARFFYIWLADTYVGRCTDSSIDSDHAPDPAAIPPKRARRKLDIVPDPTAVAAQQRATLLAAMNSDKQPLSPDLYFNTNEPDSRFEWEEAIIPWLEANFTSSDGDGGAGEAKQKANLVPMVKGRRRREIQHMASNPDDDLLPYVEKDGSHQVMKWKDATVLQCVQGIGIHFEPDDEGETAEAAFFDMDLYDPDEEQVVDFNEHFEKLFNRTQDLDEDEIRVRRHYSWGSQIGTPFWAVLE